ncbi:MAG: DinB family protein [Gemmatimonadales bacterium]
MSDSAFIERSRYYLATEYPAKIRLAVSELPHDVLWWRPNEESNSVGNLLVHLSGNIRQWVVGGIGGIEGKRDRASEFAMRDGPDASELLALLEATVKDADAVLASLNESEIDREVTIQGRATTIFAALYHVVEHFSMHTGQVLMIVKMRSPGTVRFYDDADGVAVPLWGGNERLRR